MLNTLKKWILKNKFVLVVGGFICVILFPCVMFGNLHRKTASPRTQYGLSIKREGNTPITKFMLFGERCSGSCYLEFLILKNLSIAYKPFVHKHFPPWYDLPIVYFNGNPQAYTFENTNDYLMIVIFRDPFDWARSFNRTPWWGHRDLHNIPFSEFIRRKWVLNDDQWTEEGRSINPLIDINPHNFEPFENIFHLRTAKIRNMLKIRDKVNNIYYVNYEIVKKHPEQILEEIARVYDLHRLGPYQPVIDYKGDQNQGIYVERFYDPISEEDRSYILEQLDLSLEKRIGYSTFH